MCFIFSYRILAKKIIYKQYYLPSSALRISLISLTGILLVNPKHISSNTKTVTLHSFISTVDKWLQITYFINLSGILTKYKHVSLKYLKPSSTDNERVLSPNKSIFPMPYQNFQTFRKAAVWLPAYQLNVRQIKMS